MVASPERVTLEKEPVKREQATEKYFPPFSKAGGAVKGAVVGAAATAGSSAVDAVKDPGFILFIVGLLTFIFNEYLNNTAIAVLIGTVFMFFSAFFIFKGKGMAVTVIFWVWYVFFGGVTDIEGIKYVIIPIVLVGMVVHGLTKSISKQGTFGEGAMGELLYGAIPIMVFFLDLGLLNWLAQEFNVTLSTSSQNILLFTPWWALLGLFTTQRENTFITIARMVGVVYIFSIVLLGVVPEAYGTYKSAIPTPEEFLAAKQEISEQLPARENPLISQIACIGDADYESCIQQRQEESELRSLCKKNEEVQKGVLTFDDCLTEEKKKKEEAKYLVGGVIDPTIKLPTKFKLEIDREFFPFKTYLEFSSPEYPITLKYENTRAPVKVDLSCAFVKGSEELPGKITSGESITLPVGSGTEGITCVPEGTLTGKYELRVTAFFKDLETATHLTRFFVGEKDSQEVVEIQKAIEKTESRDLAYFSTSQFPADLARFNFGFGSPPKNPLIVGGKPVQLGMSILNSGEGKLWEIKSYGVILEGFNAPCLSKSNIKIPSDEQSNKQIIIPGCQITDYPGELKNPEEYLKRTFEARMVYDYQLENKFAVEIVGKTG